MITHIRMKNFKSWKDSGEVKLAPLTGFFGKNSSGKSSLLQMLLLLKQTAERKDVEEVIFFGDESSYVNLGDFREVIHGHIMDELLELAFRCKFHEPLEIRIMQMTSAIHPDQYVRLSIDGFNFETVMSKKEGKLNIETLYYRTSQGNLEIVPHESGVFFGRERIGAVKEIKNCYGVPDSDEYGVLESNRLWQILKQFSSLFEKLFDDVYYLGPTRVNPRRNYSWGGGHPEHIKKWGDQTIDALLSARVRNLKTSHNAEEVPIEKRISYWLEKMDLAHSFSLDWTEVQGGNTYEVRIKKTSSSPSVTLVDMGYGLGQFLPVLVLCYYAPEGSTLILEQPGIHLHPMVQSQLAELLIEVVNERKLQILVESHSEHLLTRMQRQIVEEKIAVDQTAFYFCRNDEGVSEIEKLEVDKASGDIKNWPKDFFGDVMGDMFAMTDKQVKSLAEKETEG